MGYIPKTTAQKAQMLKEIGSASVEDLFASIPAAVKKQTSSGLPKAKTEQEIIAALEKAIAKDFDGQSFCGFGMYAHFIPEAVNTLSGVRNFVTSYTPYQPEVAQGTLQVLFEFQSQIAILTGMDLANASLYDGATAMVEAIRLSLRQGEAQAKGRLRKIFLSNSIHPLYLEVTRAYFNAKNCADLHVELHTLGYDETTGISDSKQIEALAEADIWVVQSPNAFGMVEENIINARKKFPQLQILLGINELHSCVFMSEEFKASVDVVWAEAQSMGIPVSFGGPSLGVIAARKDYTRQMPGRLIGKTAAKNSFGEDTDAYVITLATREQHIRREKATSNICSNQTLMAIRACIYMAQQGWDGLFKSLARCIDNAEFFKDQLQKNSRLELIFTRGENLHEICWRPKGMQKKADLQTYLHHLEDQGFLAGAILPVTNQQDQYAIISYFSDLVDHETIAGFCAKL